MVNQHGNFQIPPMAKEMYQQVTGGNLEEIMKMAKMNAAIKWSGKSFKNFQEVIDFLEDTSDIISLNCFVDGGTFYLLFARRG